VSPSYPQFTGYEPCATIGLDFYFVEKGSYTRTERDTMRDGCLNHCPLYRECLEWALRRERWGYWAGTTEIERETLRRQLGIRSEEPEYVIPVQAVSDERAA
jgi:hypothetical protein